ncbi:MAG: SDR family oxidoreductase [Spirochaetia bacterium]|nr:SDR family oxidoreductase [Spirochaetia bacterium]
MNTLKGKNALVTGGGSGIGLAIVKELASLGANVFVHYHNSGESAKAVAAMLRSEGLDSQVVQADLSTQEDSAALAGFLSSRWDQLDVLVNNTGDLIARQSLEKLDMDYYRRVMAVNLDSNVLVTKALLPLLKKAGSSSVVNLSSLAGRKGGHGGSVFYATAKGAILTLTRALSTELAPYGIRVNAVAPGLILGSSFHAIHSSEESKQATIAQIPLKRAGGCEDVARAVAFFASEYDGFITGATLDINGGIYMA